MVECWICHRTMKDLVKWVKDHADDFTDPENPLHLFKVWAEVISDWSAEEEGPFTEYNGIKVCVVCECTIRKLVARDIIGETNIEFTDFLKYEIKAVIRDALKE